MINFNRFLVSSAVASVIAMTAMWANAAEPVAARKAPACKIVYINGDMVISCPKAPVAIASRQ